MTKIERVFPESMRNRGPRIRSWPGREEAGWRQSIVRFAISAVCNLTPRAARCYFSRCFRWSALAGGKATLCKHRVYYDNVAGIAWRGTVWRYNAPSMTWRVLHSVGRREEIGNFAIDWWEVKIGRTLNLYLVIPYLERFLFFPCRSVFQHSLYRFHLKCSLVGFEDRRR